MWLENIVLTQSYLGNMSPGVSLSDRADKMKFIITQIITDLSIILISCKTTSNYLHTPPHLSRSFIWKNKEYSLQFTSLLLLLLKFIKLISV